MSPFRQTRQVWTRVVRSQGEPSNLFACHSPHSSQRPPLQLPRLLTTLLTDFSQAMDLSSWPRHRQTWAALRHRSSVWRQARTRGVISYDLMGERGDFGMRSRIYEIDSFSPRPRTGGRALTSPWARSVGHCRACSAGPSPAPPRERATGAPAGTAAPRSAPGQQAASPPGPGGW